MAVEKSRKLEGPLKPIMVITDGRRRLNIFSDRRQTLSKLRGTIREFMGKDREATKETS